MRPTNHTFFNEARIDLICLPLTVCIQVNKRVDFNWIQQTFAFYKTVCHLLCTTTADN